MGRKAYRPGPEAVPDEKHTVQLKLPNYAIEALAFYSGANGHKSLSAALTEIIEEKLLKVRR